MAYSRFPSVPAFRARGQPADARLDARFLVGRQDLVSGANWLGLPDPLIEIEDDPGLLLELGIARVHPADLAPGLQMIVGQDSLHRAQADSDPLLSDHPPDAGGKVTAQMEATLAGKLAGDGDHQRPHPIQDRCGRPRRGDCRSESPFVAQRRRHLHP